MKLLPTVVSRCIRTALLGCLPLLAGCDTSSDEEDLTLFKTAQNLEADRRFPAAVDAYRRFIEGEGGDTHNTYAMIKVSVLEESIRNGADPLLDLYLEAVDLREAGNWAEALTILDSMLEQGPHSRLADDALYLKGYIHLVDKLSLIHISEPTRPY